MAKQTVIAVRKFTAAVGRRQSLQAATIAANVFYYVSRSESVFVGGCERPLSLLMFFVHRVSHVEFRFVRHRKVRFVFRFAAEGGEIAGDKQCADMQF